MSKKQRIEQLEQQVADLEQRIAELEARPVINIGPSWRPSESSDGATYPDWQKSLPWIQTPTITISSSPTMWLMKR
jgi:hypothetical protein